MNLGVSIRLRRIEAVAAVTQLFSRFHHLCAAGEYDKAADLLAQTTPGLSVELADWGVYEGLDHAADALIGSLRRMATVHSAGLRQSRPDLDRGHERAGLLLETALMTPVIHAADDGVTARGLWMGLGAQSGFNPGAGTVEASWVWAQHAVDFVLEDGEWKILHYRVAPRFRCPYSESWVVAAARGPQKPPPGLAPPADGPSTGEATEYSSGLLVPYDPVPPAPYRTFAESASYGPAHLPLPPAGSDPEVPTSVGPELVRRLQRLEDVHAISNLMGMHEYLHVAGRNGEELDTVFAREAPDSTFEPEDWGTWVGLDSIRACYVDGAPPMMPGLVTEHALTTPVIEVAADGQTAKGVWISPGHETFPRPQGGLAHWSWGRYGVDFVKEHGEWKVWHFHIYTTFRTPYEVDWVESAVHRPAHLPEPGATMPNMRGPDRPVSFNQPYHPDQTPVLQPLPPRPYETWAETWSYTDRPPVSA